MSDEKISEKAKDPRASQYFETCFIYIFFKNFIYIFREETDSFRMSWRRGLVVSSPQAAEEIRAKGPETEYMG
jgi:hypothetical protein